MKPVGDLDTRIEQARLALAHPGLLRETAFVAGEWTEGEGSIPVLNPATGRPLGSVPRLSRQQVEGAVEAAHRALASWRSLAAKDRSRFLRRWFELVVAHGEDLARLMTAEQGKPLAEARAEVAYAASFIEWFAEEAKRIYGDTIPGHRADTRLVVIKQPVGVVAAITPWNFPAAMITRKVAPALAVGCTVVLKPSELTPFSALALAYLASEAGIPAGVLNVVTGDPAAVGEVLTGDPRIRKLTFTGSTAVGKRLAARCMDTVKRVSLELGGNAPFIVFEDADLDRAVEGAMASKFRNTGQTCVCANRVLVHEAVYDEFARKLSAAAAALRIGDGLEGATDQGPLINEPAVLKVERHVRDAVDRGARLLVGGDRSGPAGRFFAPTVLSGVTRDMLIFREETFGPVAGLVRFASEQEAIRLANDTSAGLAAYVYTRDAARIWRLGEALEYGMVGLNTGLISTEVAPFGGVKESGLGREGSRYGAEEFLDVKLLCSSVSA
ncbi:MAG: NAD-dependent succinate-semialdehyde dehydrogenase [Gammaproteobacteria bacterium]|jgi:succinate-semialdehyde dehydrogenase/glutarate-semialdehyde dehydrogenase|nr:NAD-dependent succinate-semialdehyde dehydrogenase [Gammaproteobacteria bacterium]